MIPESVLQYNYSEVLILKRIVCTLLTLMLLLPGALAESWYTKVTADYFGTESVLRIRTESSVCEAVWR